ncbi:hypothetical protein [Aminobacter sp. MSH1]|uniref:hypothetical protein n=1 Tax=Aminobacter sp. MSH1 TaxID=374606 RepID=UPI00131F323D|nr:hypothetical protein [Aminobacter sp. MSH1]
MAALANRQRRRKIQAFALVKMSSFTGSGPLVPGNLPTPALAISREQHAFVILGRSRSEATCGDPGIHAVTLEGSSGAELKSKKIQNRGEVFPAQPREICSSCSTVSGLTPSGNGSTAGCTAAGGAATGAGGTGARAAQAERVARARRAASNFMVRALGGRCGGIAAADEPGVPPRSSHPDIS